MTGFNTQIGMNFIQRYDQNGDGLSKQEIQQGKMDNYFGMMKSMATGDVAGLQTALQNLQFASVAGQNFDILSQAAQTTQFGDNNSQTISPLDLLKTASNDGNTGNLTPADVKSQYRQNAQAQQNQNQNPIMQLMQMLMQMIQQMMGNQNQNAYNNGLTNTGSNYCQDNGNNYGLPSNYQLPYTNGASNYSSPSSFLYGNNSNSSYPSYNYSGVGYAQGGYYGEQESMLESIGGLPGSLMEGIGDAAIGVADWVQGGFDKVGETLGQIPLVGGLLEAGTKISGAIFTAPTKIAGSIVKGVGSAVKDVGKSIGKALSKL